MANKNTALEWSGPYLIAVKDLLSFTLMMPELPDWQDAEDPLQRLCDLECLATGALPSDL